MRFANRLDHGAKYSCRKTILRPKPILMGFSNAFQNTGGRSVQHDGARCVRIAFGHEMLRYPAIVSRAPNSKRRPSAFFITGSQNIQEGFPATEHPSPVLSDLLDVRSETSGFVGI